MSVTTHVLDTFRGRPAAGVDVRLEARDGEGWRELGSGRTDADGRAGDLLGQGRFEPGVFRLRFATGEYFRELRVEGFYPEVTVIFQVEDPGSHHHVPLLLSPFGYTTYRGS
jgi:hydroxyisourate hydrolase